VSGCGYRVAGRANTLGRRRVRPSRVPAFEIAHLEYRIDSGYQRRVRELLADTRYHVVSNPATATLCCTAW